ncbi:Ig-like domain-containing protein [Methanobrevibacter sp. UBA212]|uniref:Ig-like domain-containing protein n=1 Tax=Methanobrevibacter sp. UBA212 TaxID=1915476 RepID=UPI0025EFC95B|nr:Ig-like domain-containing protein [Methanobrevibacter sp. UBA212]
MKIKRIMLITFLLLAVLAIGAVSAADDVASDNMTVSDDVDVITDADDEYGIEINEDEIYIDDEEEYDIAWITLPEITKGSFQILNGEEVVTRLDVDDAVIARLDDDEDDHWSYDEDYGFEGTIYLEDLALKKVHDGDVLSFKFFKLDGNNNVEEKIYTKLCNVSLTDTTMRLIEVGHSGMTEDDVDIQVNNIDTKKPDENFTYIEVAPKYGVFIISVENEDDNNPTRIFKENLNTTNRPFENIEKNGKLYYRFGFSFTDINNYIAQNTIYNNFNEVVESENEIYFYIYENDEKTEIDSKTMIINLDKDGLIVFEEENEYVDVDYGDLDIIMYDGWNETHGIEFEISAEIDGKIVIYLNETLAFEKELTADDSDEDEDYYYYFITLADLKITQAGKYVIRDYFYDNDGKMIYSCDEEDPEVLTLYEPQTMTVDNVTIDVNPIPATITGNESLITVNENASAEDEVLVYIDGNETPIPIRVGDCGKDEDGNYVIGTKELKLEVGAHNLTISYKGHNLTANVTLYSNIVIEIMDEDPVYTTFNEVFVYIGLDDNDMNILEIEGTINLTLTDKDGKSITISKAIEDFHYNVEDNTYEILTGDVNAELNGTYAVVVKYFNDNEGTTQSEGNVTFKSFDPKEYGTSITDIIKNGNDYAITFTDIPLDCDILVKFDGTTTKISESDLRKWIDETTRAYYIKYSRLNGTSDGTHSISVFLDNKEQTELASANVFVDVEENFDLGLTIIPADIEEGKIANVEITTNSTFTGDILVQVANQNHTVIVVNGKGNISLTGLKADTYTVTAIFKSNGIFSDSTKTKTFKVTSKPVTPAKKANVIKLTLKKVKIKKSAKKLVLKATLKINGKAVKGKKVIFKFKGKKYTGKTSKSGVAKVTIKKKVLKKLKVGKKVTYSAKYSTKTVKKTVKVKK